ncbi:MAG: MoaD/ThiS family protein [Pseudomonadota bacterium]|nr:MAG: MoaD/ThiS family protein [Pseudomonadota bacterium]
MVRILYFAQLVDRLGTSAEELTPPSEVTTVRALLEHLRQRGPDWRRVLADDTVRVTVDRQLASLDTSIAGAKEIGLLSARP